MLDDADTESPAFDPPDPERVYRNYLKTCKRLGVTPTPRDRAKALIEEWTDALATGRSDPPNVTHCARRGRFAAMNGAARLFAETGASAR